MYVTSDSMGTREKSSSIISLVASEEDEGDEDDDEELEPAPSGPPAEVVFVWLPGSGHPPRVHWQESPSTQPSRLPTMTLLG